MTTASSSAEEELLNFFKAQSNTKTAGTRSAPAVPRVAYELIYSDEALQAILHPITNSTDWTVNYFTKGPRDTTGNLTNFPVLQVVQGSLEFIASKLPDITGVSTQAHHPSIAWHQHEVVISPTEEKLEQIHGTGVQIAYHTPVNREASKPYQATIKNNPFELQWLDQFQHICRQDFSNYSWHNTEGNIIIMSTETELCFLELPLLNPGTFVDISQAKITRLNLTSLQRTIRSATKDILYELTSDTDQTKPASNDGLIALQTVYDCTFEPTSPRHIATLFEASWLTPSGYGLRLIAYQGEYHILVVCESTSLRHSDRYLSGENVVHLGFFKDSNFVPTKAISTVKFETTGSEVPDMPCLCADLYLDRIIALILPTDSGLDFEFGPLISEPEFLTTYLNGDPYIYKNEVYLNRLVKDKYHYVVESKKKLKLNEFHKLRPLWLGDKVTQFTSISGKPEFTAVHPSLQTLDNTYNSYPGAKNFHLLYPPSLLGLTELSLKVIREQINTLQAPDCFVSTPSTSLNKHAYNFQFEQNTNLRPGWFVCVHKPTSIEVHEFILPVGSNVSTDFLESIESYRNEITSCLKGNKVYVCFPFNAPILVGIAAWPIIPEDSKQEYRAKITAASKVPLELF